MMFFNKFMSSSIAFVFAVMTVCPANLASAQSISQILPQITITPSTGTFSPAMIEGIKLYQNDPLKFDFLINAGDTQLAGDALQAEILKLSRYFLAALTVPQDQLWVNLSPYEKDRIVPDTLGKTEMGRDMLAQDYLLKQMTSTLISPENEYGRKFWDRIYKEAQERFGTTELPTNSFSKVWIIPSEAKIYTHNNTVYVSSSHLKVMQQNDYAALSKSLGIEETGISSEQQSMDEVSSKIFQEIIVPQLEFEVNNGEYFAPLRQIFRGLILAIWYKGALQQTLLGRQYINQEKISGVSADAGDKEAIYQQYLKALESGVANMISEEYDPTTQQMIPKQYFTGGENLTKAQAVEADDAEMAKHQGLLVEAINNAQLVDATVQLQVSPGVNYEHRTLFAELGYQAAVYNPEFGLLTLRKPERNVSVPEDLNLRTRDMTSAEKDQEAQVLAWARKAEHLDGDFQRIRILVQDDTSFKNQVYALPIDDTLFVREDFFRRVAKDPDISWSKRHDAGQTREDFFGSRGDLDDFVREEKAKSEEHYQPVVDALADILGGKALTADPTIIGGNQEQPFQLVFHPDQEGVNTLHQTSRLNATTLAFADPESGATVVGTPHPYGVKIVHMTAVFDAKTELAGTDVVAALKTKLADAGYRFEQQIATVQLTDDKKNVIDDKSFAIKQTEVGVQVDFYLWYNDGSAYKAAANNVLGAYPEVQGSLVEKSRVKQPQLSRKIRVAINGSAGRIGKPLLYTILRYLRNNIDVVAVNGTDADRLMRGAEFDSTHQGLLRPGETATKDKDDVGEYVLFNLFNDDGAIETHKVYAFNDRSKIFGLPNFEELRKKLQSQGIVRITGVTVMALFNVFLELIGKLTSRSTLKNLPWAKLNIDIAVEATGAFTAPEQLNEHIKAGAKKVLLTAPSKPDESGDKVNPFVIGVNSEDIIKGKLCDGASCTTNSTGAAYKVFLRGLKDNAFSFGLDEEQGVGAYFKRLIGLSITFIAGSLLTIHAITNTQPAFDNTSSSNAEKMYAAFSNFILSSTGAAKALGPLLAELKGKIFANSIRVPNVTNGSLTVTKDIISVPENEELTPEIVNQRFRMAANTPDYYGVIDVKPGMASSSQILGRSEAGIIAPEATRVTFLKNKNGKNIYLVVTAKWYDNEWGYTQRISDALFAMGEQIINEEGGSDHASMAVKVMIEDQEVEANFIPNNKIGQTQIKIAGQVFGLVPGDVTDVIAQSVTIESVKSLVDNAAMNGGVNFNAEFFKDHSNLLDIPIPQGSLEIENMQINGGLTPALINYQVITSPLQIGLGGEEVPGEEDPQVLSFYDIVFDRVEQYV